MPQDRMTLKKVAKWLAWSMIAMAVIVFTAWATSPDPRFNPASFEDKPLVQGLAPLEQAITLAQFRAPNGDTHTLLVLGREGESVILTCNDHNPLAHLRCPMVIMRQG